MLRATVFLALICCAAAFTAPALPSMQLRAPKAAISMSAQNPMAKFAKALAPAIAAVNVAVPAAFAEGTGEALGIDDTRLFVPIILIPVLVFISYAGFASSQDNEDFFDTYDQRRK